MKIAVEWLQIMLIPILYDEEDVEHNKKCWEQAKEMEKEQKISLLEWIRNNAVEVQGGWQYDNWTYTDKEILEVYYKLTKQQEQ
jgi:hypothetical protein